MFKKIIAGAILAYLLATTAYATISIPFSFSPNTTISSSQMNSNFSTIAEAALNRHGDNIDGTVTIGSGVTFGTGGGKISVTSTAADAIKSSGGITAGSGAVAVIGTDGKIPAFSSTYFASIFLPIKTYTETKTTPTIGGGALTIDLSLGTQFFVDLNGNATVSISNWCASNVCGFTVYFKADGTPRTLTWPGAVKWAGGAAPTPTSTNNKWDVYSFVSGDAGTTIYGFVLGQNF